MAALRAALVAASLAGVLAPVTASACQWEIYDDSTVVVEDLIVVEHPNARCVSP